MIGVNNLSLSVEEHLMHTEPLYIVMSNPFLNSLCTSVMIVMVLVNTINMGAQLDMAIIVQVFRKPVGPGVGFISQFLFMPLFSFLVGWLVTEDVLFRYTTPISLYFLLLYTQHDNKPPPTVLGLCFGWHWV